ncbi:MAG: cytochrome d ubiquinol oxidase subunit II, partial [Planctomycetota bacterium]
SWIQPHATAPRKSVAGSHNPLACSGRLWVLSTRITAALLLGIAAGNLLAGMELGPKFHYQGSLSSQVTWYPLMVGSMTVSLFALHGAVYLYLKTEDVLQQRVKSVIVPLFCVFCVAYALVTVATWYHVPHATANLSAFPWLWIVPALNFLAVLNIPRAMHLGRPGYAFFTSSMVILALTCLFSVAIFPNLMLSNLSAEYSVTVWNGRSSHQTLWTMLIIAIIGIPCVLSYTILIYWIFRGKVRLDPNSY